MLERAPNEPRCSASVNVGLVVLGLSLFLAAGCAADASDAEASATDEAALSTNSDARKVLVYSNNVENMIFDWKDLLYYMRTRPSRPDIFLVQQMTSRARLDEMTKAMTSVLGVAYAGRVAQDNPTNLRQSTEVSPRPTVTTGIIFRAARFDVLSEETWFPLGASDPATGATDCSVRHASSAYQTIKLRLRDKVANRNLTVVSLRHPTGSPCPAANIADIEAHLHAQEDLSLVGGDFNDNPTGTKVNGTCWYRSMVGRMTACAGSPDLRFADPLYDDCAGNMTCVQSRQGIDFIFGRNGAATPARTSDYQRATFAEGNAANIKVTGTDGLSNTVAADRFDDVSSDYSQHTARSAFFWYP